MDFEKQFIDCFQKIAPQYRRSEVFFDFITISALEMYLIIYKDRAENTLKERFHAAKSRYSQEEFTQLSKLFAITVKALTDKRDDFLGSVFMQLELGDNYKGQFFTPSHIADLMAKITLQGCEAVIEQQGFVTLSEPTCGSGVMAIGCVNALIDAGFNPQQQLWVECQDIDFTAAMICYIQLSLLHIPARIIVGDSLLNESNIEMYTLAHLMGNWSNKLAQQKSVQKPIQTETDQIPPSSASPPDSLSPIIELNKDDVIFY